MLLGEAWGEHEERERTAFVGPTGHLLNEMLLEVGIHPSECYKTNVFNRRPPRNLISAFCGDKASGIDGYPALQSGKYVRNEFEPEFVRLTKELNAVAPNVIVAFGNTATWALLGKPNIGAMRGFTYHSTHLVVGLKVLPTYHPAAILRLWEYRPTVLADLHKAKRESKYPDIKRPKREVWIEPTLEDLETFYERYIVGCSLLSVDIETAGSQVTCIGFAPGASVSLVIPFYDSRAKTRSYWPNEHSESQAWHFVQRVLATDVPKLFQNGLYDITFLLRSMGIKVRNAKEDTMLLHHALQPESLKGLGYLGSIYTNEHNWKIMRDRVTKTIKRDD